ncbi:MAG TPA: nucleotidyltransferase family protein [Casimicrobiaceae bacterium]|nr:nucleotidyltransferase family protein [Casimicrobiaceae bacterium]
MPTQGTQLPGAMILAAGRGERMRPLTDHTPKPLLRVLDKPLIGWQIEGLVAAGLRDIVANAAHLADRLIEDIGDGARYGARVRWSREREPLEVGGGIVTALPLLPRGPTIVAAGDVWTRYDYGKLRARALEMTRDASDARVHLLMVPNPVYHREGDFSLGAADSRTGLRRLLPRDARGAKNVYTYASIGVFDTTLFAELTPHVKLKLLPLLNEWIEHGLVSAELYEGPWANVGTPADLDALNAELGSATRAA